MIKFTPLNDQILIRLDARRVSETLHVPGQSQKVLPSGEVLAVGRGVMTAQGFAGPQVAVGDHVAIDLKPGWRTLPLDKSSEIYIAVSEAQVIGKLEGATRDSAWFAALEERSDLLV